jgi:hypothetical protein
MPLLTGSRRAKRLGIGTLALLGVACASLQSAPADARGLLDATVVAYVPAPYAHTYVAYYGSTPSFGNPYYGGPYFGFGGHHWY